MENKKSHHIQIHLEKEIDEIVAALAEEEDRTQTMMCKRLIKEALKARGKIGGVKQ